ncbi:MAG: imidazolonepropionase [Tenericutes bacterium HGW-Tenericutes-6]|jgi:imidazolonepropionase|nr:MAG: imidazolonepropionase [Tenericutes bacterium HGW-Tenericutes-6]
MIADLVIKNIKTIYTPYLKPPVRGKDLMSIEEIHEGFIAIKDGKIIELGTGDGHPFMGPNTAIYDAKYTICIPGLIDSHTHLVHGGSREHEYRMLKEGKPYMDILKQGGGIFYTVEQTRSMSEEDLYQKAFKSLCEMMLYGVTAIESKSGYGLEEKTELKQLRVNKKLHERHPVHVVSTYMGAHAMPKGYEDKRKHYIQEMKQTMVKIKNHELAEAVDVFCEKGVYDIEETKDILLFAKSLGFKIKLHADEIESMGGAGLGVELGATSVDHLMAIKDEDIKKLSTSETIANLLPGTSYYLNKGYARARQMIDQNVAISIAGDYNPGSCPTENFQFILSLASKNLGLFSEEILHAACINPAFHLGLDHLKGSLEKGKDADFVLLDAPNLDYLWYHFGINHTKDVFIGGKPVVINRRIVRDVYETR